MFRNEVGLFMHRGTWIYPHMDSRWPAGLPVEVAPDEGAKRQRPEGGVSGRRNSANRSPARWRRVCAVEPAAGRTWLWPVATMRMDSAESGPNLPGIELEPDSVLRLHRFGANMPRFASGVHSLIGNCKVDYPCA